MKKLSIFLIAALLTFLVINSVKKAKASNVELTTTCGCQSPTPTPTALPTSTPTVTPTSTETPLTCPQDYHLNASGQKCVQFELGGAPPPPPVNKTKVLGVSTTLASTGLNTNLRILVAIITSGVIFSVYKKYNL